MTTTTQATPATADQLFAQLVKLREQRATFLRKDGRPPYHSAKWKRMQYDALMTRIDHLITEWCRADAAERAAKEGAE